MNRVEKHLPMRLEARRSLREIQVAAERIARFTQGKQLEQYLADEMLRSAVERQLTIIAQALSRLDKDASGIAAAIPEHGRIVAMRNVLLRGDAMNDRAVWGAIDGGLAALGSAVARLLGARNN